MEIHENVHIAFILSPVARSRPEKSEFNDAKALCQNRFVFLEHPYELISVHNSLRLPILLQMQVTTRIF